MNFKKCFYPQCPQRVWIISIYSVNKKYIFAWQKTFCSYLCTLVYYRRSSKKFIILTDEIVDYNCSDFMLIRIGCYVKGETRTEDKCDIKNILMRNLTFFIKWMFVMRKVRKYLKYTHINLGLKPFFKWYLVFYSTEKMELSRSVLIFVRRL